MNAALTTSYPSHTSIPVFDKDLSRIIVKISIIIPVYNEQLYVSEVLNHLLCLPWPSAWDLEIIVVDDGSTDLTRSILQNFVREKSVRIFYQEKNFGKGNAIREALKHVTGDIVLIQDADLEYSIADYPALLEPIVAGRAQVVYGSRFLGRITGMKLANRIFNIFIRMMANILFDGSITDEATAYKVFRTDVIHSLNLKSSRFEICPEMTAKVLKRGIMIHEVPIRYRARNHKDGKKITWKDAFSAIGTLVKYWWLE